MAIEEGVVSEGTMRASDLIRAFWSEYQRHYEEHVLFSIQSDHDTVFEALGTLPDAEFDEAVNAGGPLDDDAGYLLEAMVWDLEAVAEEQGFLFGTSEGDGACWGFWEKDGALP